MRIQHNIMAMNAYRNYNNNTSALAKNLEKLSSGYRINRAGDDAAGLAISEKMRAQITGLDAAQKNVKDGVSLVKTAEGAMQEIHDMLGRMKYLATQSSNGTYDNEVDRKNIQKEVESLKSEIDRIADSANFNGQKLLDGSLRAESLSEVPVKFETTSATKGLTIGEATQGGGTKGTYTIDVNTLFSEGDTVKIDFNDSTGAAKDATFTMKNKPNGATEFGGATLEEQAQNLADKIKVHADIGSNFDVTLDGTKITLTAKKEGTDSAAYVTDVAATDKKVAGTPTATPATAGNNGNEYKGSVGLVGGIANGANVEVGDKLTFNFKGLNGEDLKVELEVTADMVTKDAKQTAANIAEALKNAHFQDNASTSGVDESKLTVGDIFKVEPNKDKTGATADGALHIESGKNANDTTTGLVDMELNRKGAKQTFAADKTDATKATNATKGSYKLDVTGTDNYSKGDKIAFEGKLADGRSFKLMLEAGKDFEIGNNVEATLKNIATALVKKDVKVELTNADGTTSTMTGEDLFGAKGEFDIAAGTANELTITSKHEGTEASQITAITPKPLDPATVGKTHTNAEAQTAAQSSFTVDSQLGYGSAVKVGNTTYEIVKDLRDTTNRNNTAIVVDDPTDSAAVAKALAEAIGKDNADYDVTHANGTVTMTSKKIGSDQKALEVSAPYGESVTTASFKFDPKTVREGSTLTFNGKTYEFVKAGEKSKSGGIAIEVADFEKATAKELGEAFADVAKNGVASVGEDGTVTLKSLADENGVIATPELVLGNEGLKLQIGDTSDEYNQLAVAIEDMHAKALGIGDLKVDTQKDAHDAIDKIMDAINTVSSTRGSLGAIQNRLEHTEKNLSVMQESIQDAESAIRDTDVAAEMMKYTKNNILIQSAQAMLAQANQVPQGVLQLLQ